MKKSLMGTSVETRDVFDFKKTHTDHTIRIHLHICNIHVKEVSDLTLHPVKKLRNKDKPSVNSALELRPWSPNTISH